MFLEWKDIYCCHCYCFKFFSQCRKLNLLSFGEEAEEEEKEVAAVKQKIKSSHDVLNDPRLLKEDIPSKELVMIPHLLVSFKISVCFMIRGYKYIS